MRSPCSAIMATARELLDFGILPEASKELAELRECANTCGCEEWQDCRDRTAGAWRGTNPDASPKPTSEEGAPAIT